MKQKRIPRFSQFADYVGFAGEKYSNRTTIYVAPTFSGQVNLDYRTKISRLQDASSPFSTHFITAIAETPREARVVKLVGGIRKSAWELSFENSNPNYYLSAYPISSSADAIALAKIKNRLSHTTEFFKALVPLGELKETFGLVRSINKLTVDFLQSSASLPGGPSKVARNMARAWLTYGFGVRPLIGDVGQLLATVSDHLEAPKRFVRCHGSSKLEYLESTDLSNQTDVLGINWVFRDSALCRYKVDYHAGIIPFTRYTADYSAASKFGLTWRDVPGALWELTPYSWIVDYVTNFGDVVDDLFWSPPGNTTYITKTTTLISEHDSSSAGRYTDPSMVSFFSKPGHRRYVEVRCDRSVLASLPHASFRLKTGDEIAKYGLNKITNLVALLVSRKRI